MDKEYIGQFPSKNCKCHISEVYGFVPEANCPEHDNEQFIEFIKRIEERQQRKFIGLVNGIKAHYPRSNFLPMIMKK